MVTLEQFKSYFRIDSDFEDELLQQFLETATNYLTGAISNYADNYTNYEEFRTKADLLTMIIAAEFYQNRDNSAHELSYVIRSMMAQLQYFCGSEVEKEGGEPSSSTVDDDDVATIDDVDDVLDNYFN